MRILFSLTYYSPYVSGLTLCVARIAEGLSKKHAVTLMCMRHDSSLLTEENREGVRVIRAKPLFKISKGFFSVDWIFKSFSEVKKSDTVVVNLPQMEGIVPAVFAKILGKKLLTIYHCNVKLSSGLLNRAIETCLSFSNRVILFLSDKIIVYTEDFAKNTSSLIPFSKKSEYIYPPFIKPLINKRIQNSIREKIGTNCPLVIGIAARLAAEKGIEYVLECIPELSSKLKVQSLKVQAKTQNFKILIAGPLDPVGEEEYKKKILKLVEGYKEYVEFVGTIKPEEMGSFYSLLDVLVLPSINSTESFGMVQVEAMMYGVPVVATNLSGVRVPIEKTGMGIVIPIKDSNSIAKAILKICENKSEFIRRKNEIEKIFSYPYSIQNYQHVITSL